MHPLLSELPEEVKPWAAIGIGSFILVCLVLFHGFGLHWVLIFQIRGQHRLLNGRPHLVRAVLLFGASIFFMLSLHLIEVSAWAIALFKLGLIERGHDAAYFCANAYTTLGYGAVDLAVQFRNISPIIGISGLFTFAWTTSALVSVVSGHNHLLKLLDEEWDRAKLLRAQLRNDIRDVHNREHQAELAGRIDAKEKMHGAGLRERWGIWQSEKKNALALREAELKEITDLYQKEQAEEDKLGPGDGSEKGEGKK
jgi:hypothetical protein